MAVTFLFTDMEGSTRYWGRAREALGFEESAAAWAEGRSIGWKAAVEEALAAYPD